MKLLSIEIDERFEGVKKKVIIIMDSASYHWVSQNPKYRTEYSITTVQTSLIHPRSTL